MRRYFYDKSSLKFITCCYQNLINRFEVFNKLGPQSEDINFVLIDQTESYLYLREIQRGYPPVDIIIDFHRKLIFIELRQIGRTILTIDRLNKFLISEKIYIKSRFSKEMRSKFSMKQLNSLLSEINPLHFGDIELIHKLNAIQINKTLQPINDQLFNGFIKHKKVINKLFHL